MLIAHATQVLLQAVVIFSIVLVFQGILVLLEKIVCRVHVIRISSQVDQVRVCHVQANLIRFLVAHHVNVKPDTKEEIIRKYIMAVCSELHQAPPIEQDSGECARPISIHMRLTIHILLSLSLAFCLSYSLSLSLSLSLALFLSLSLSLALFFSFCGPCGRVVVCWWWWW